MQRNSDRVQKPKVGRKTSAGKGEAAAKKITNPFDLKYAKSKFDVLNKKISLAGRPSESKARSQLVREKTLLNQINGRKMASKLSDKRIDKSVSLSSGYEAAMSSRTQSGKGKKSLYDLVGEGDDADLTHDGRALEKMAEDELDDELLGDEEDVDYSEITRGLADPTKTKAEVMREVIAKSKYYKAERQRIRDENEELREDLDAKFDEHIRGSLEIRTRRDRFEQEDATDMDEYDSFMKDISFQPRAAATDPLSPEERSKKNVEKQRELEKEKSLRMLEEEEENGEEFKFVSNNSENEGIETEAAGKLDLFLEQFCYAKTAVEANERYGVIISLLKENQTHVVDLGKAIRRWISKSFESFIEKLGTSQPGVFPDCSQVLLLKLVGTVFSTSDYHHVIATPATLLAVCYLQLGRISKPRHLWIGLEICKVLLSYQTESKRYIPEIFGFLASAFSILGYPKNSIFFCKTVPKPVVFGDDEQTVSLFDCASASKAKVLSFLLEVLDISAKLHADSLSFPEIFGAFCHQLESEEEKIKDLKERVMDFKRTPLMLQNHKPIPLPQLEPELDDDRMERKRRSRSSAQDAAEEAKRLMVATKKEMKGAKRELRKDAAFMAKHQRYTKTQASAEYKEKINRLYGNIGNGN